VPGHHRSRGAARSGERLECKAIIIRVSRGRPYKTRVLQARDDLRGQGSCDVWMSGCGGGFVAERRIGAVCHDIVYDI
jgi:hypothetical protein